MTACASHGAAVTLPTTDGFYGIWYEISPGIGTGEYGPKYGGGLGTYPNKASPLAIYSPEANKTFFTYGGTSSSSSNVLRNYISYYDHETGLLARPREIRNVGGNDNHKAAPLVIDDDGYIWVFALSHGDSGTGNLYKSASPHDITDFDEVTLPSTVFLGGDGQNSLAYGNPYYVPGQGFLLLFNKYDDGRAVHIATSTDGVNWINPRTGFEESDRLMKIAGTTGHYALARPNGTSIGIIANMHPGGLDNRTNLFYLETDDFGQTWQAADGTEISGAITSTTTPALVYDYQSENQLVYLKDIDYDDQDNPILMYLTVSDETGTGHYPGPQPGGRMVHTAHWNGTSWDIHDVVATDHNYDSGGLSVEEDGTWQIVAPFLDGPQPWGTGGAIGVWESENEGVTWNFVQQISSPTSEFNDTYVIRPVNFNDDFFAYWADGNAYSQSQSRLYFADKEGNVFQMPTDFEGDFAAPISVPFLRSDLNNDHNLSIADWLIFIENDLKDLTSLPVTQWREMGDINEDGTIDTEDFVLFKKDYEQLNGSGAFAKMLQNVPEPSGLMLFGLALVGLAPGVNRGPRST